jgi:inosose dehydratase
MTTNDTFCVANAPCSWGVLETHRGVRPPWERVLDEIAGTGYMGTELGAWGYMPTEPEPLHDALASRGLAMVGAFVPAGLRDERSHAECVERAVRTARLLAALAERQPDAARPHLVLSDDNCADVVRERCAGHILSEDGMDDASWTAFAQGAERVARAVLDQTGIRTVFHHHAGGFIETPREVAALMDRTDPDLVGLCLDTGHYAFGGGDPAGALRAYGARVRHVHFKDCNPRATEVRDRTGAVVGFRSYREALRNQVFCELGRGTVEFGGVLSELRAIGYEGWIVVEQDAVPGATSCASGAKRNLAYLTWLGMEVARP